jgi:hypothetical protein
MKMGELPIDQERLGRPARLAGRQDERPSARHRNAARLLDNTGQGKDTVCELLNPTQVGWLLIELGVRVGRCRARALADPRGQHGIGRAYETSALLELTNPMRLQHPADGSAR